VKLKIGDKLIVIAGSNKGKIGKLNKIFSKENKVIVEGVNLVKKHKKPAGKDQTGGIVEFEAPIHISNVMLVDSKTGKGSRKRSEAIVKKDKTVKKEVKTTKVEPKKETKVEKQTTTVKGESKKVVKKIAKAEPKKEKEVSKKTNKKNDK
jgi:large subunit ribosomal protein L24